MAWRWRRPARVIAASSSALLLFAAGEPVRAGWLAWVALIPLLWAVLGEKRWRWTVVYGAAFGIVFFGLHLWWIFLFGWIAWLPLVAFLTLYLCAAVFLGGVMRRWPLAPVLVAGAWAGMELVRDRWPFGGFPWGTIGTTQVTVPGVRWLAGVVGVYGLTFLAVLVSALVADRIIARRWSWASLALVGAVLGVFVGVDAVRYGSPPDGRPLQVLVVQGGVPRPPLPNQRDVIFESHAELTRRHITPDVDVVVWPEDSLGIGVRDSAPDELAALARELGVPLLIGRSTVDRPSREFLNTVEHVTAAGERAGVYVKRHPVPFGEYVPLSFLRGAVSTLEAEIPYDMRRGTDVEVFDVEGARIATPICFESVFPRDFLDFSRQGAELYVLSTNNASFERSYASPQHLAHSRMRALETRQWVVQAALAGTSGVVRPDGVVEQPTELFTSTAFRAEVRTRPAHSLYARVGDLFPAGFAVGVLVAMLVYGYALVASRGTGDAGRSR